MIHELANHLWQSTLFASLVTLLTLMLRRHRAAVRYRLWLSASVKFLVPFSLLVGIGSRVEWHKAPVVPPRPLQVLEQINEPFALPISRPLMVSAPLKQSRLPAVLFAVWFCGFLANSLTWWRCWRRARASLQTATPLRMKLPVRAMSCPAPLEPGLVGIRKPILLLPQGITGHLTPAQFEAVVAHELCHMRRRDNLTAAIHMAVEAVFWFHPLVWWIGHRLVEERELACDEAVLRMGTDPKDYAEGIVKTCRLYLESRLICVPAVTGGNLRERVRRIMLNRGMPDLTPGGKLLLAMAGMLAVAGPLMLGIFDAPKARAQAKPESSLSASLADDPGFEVATIKPTEPGKDGPVIAISAGKITFTGFTLKHLIGYAYWIHANQVIGGARWMDSDEFDITAKPEKGFVSFVEDSRKMLQTLLVDRFRLKFHHDTRELPAYVLSVAKGGSKMKPRTSGDGGGGFRLVPEGSSLPGRNASMAQFAFVLQTVVMDRPVLDRTELAGNFDFNLSWAPDETQFGGRGGKMPSSPDSPDIFAAMQEQLGLKLESRKVPVDVLIVDEAERPGPN
jgi:bla regulator protein BlaR1